MTDAERQVLFIVWADYRERIAALKSRRWSTTQWAVTANLALSAAAASQLAANAPAKGIFLLFSLLATALGATLVRLYNSQIAHLRSCNAKAACHVRQHIFDYNKALGTNTGLPKAGNHDQIELWLFDLIMLASLIAPLAAASI